MSKFKTKLTPQEEQQFLEWYKIVALKHHLDLNPDHPDHHYDYRGFWKNSSFQEKLSMLGNQQMHFPDTYKTPMHPTFSNESIYSTPFMMGGNWDGDKFIDSDWTKSREYIPTLEDLVKFTKSYEDFSPIVYELENNNGVKQKLIGYGFADADLIAKGNITKKEADRIIIQKLKKIEDALAINVPNWDKLTRGTQLAMIDTAYNCHGAKTIYAESPKLMAMLNSGIIDPRILVKELDHSKNAKGWAGVRSSARRAMALGLYYWNSPHIDSLGRHVRPDITSNVDSERSPYLGFRKGGIIQNKYE